MQNPDQLAALYSLTAARLAEIKATQEVILKAQATFLGVVTHQPWEPVFEDLRNQAREAARVYREQILNEIELLRRSRPGA